MYSQTCLALSLAVVLLLSLPGPRAVAANGAQSCPLHVVKRGETLRIIAERYLGRRDRSGEIYRANRQMVGPNPNLIEPGMRLRVPCRHDAKPQAAAANIPPPTPATPDPQPATAAVPPPKTPPPPADPVTAADLTAPTARPTPGSAAGLVAPRDRLTTGPSPALAQRQSPRGQQAFARLAGMGGGSAAEPPSTLTALETPRKPVEHASIDAPGEPPAIGPSAAVQAAATPPSRRAPENTASGEPSAVTDTAMESDLPPGEVFVLTGAPYLPFVDPTHPGGGMIVELVLAAFAETEGPPVRIGFVNDRPSHLDIILPRGGFAFSFPWLMGDCDQAERTAPQSALCDRFQVSDSLYEHVTEFYVRADSPLSTARDLMDMSGARICRPSGYPIDDLVLAGLLPEQATLIRRRTPADCLAALDQGQADVASMDATLARALVARTTPENPIMVLDSLTRIERLHAVALKEDQAGLAAIERLNAGVAILVETGLWVRIVNRHLGLEG